MSETIGSLQRSGKPAPASSKAVGRPSKYPLASMQVGDWFDITIAEGDDLLRAEKRVRGSVATWRIRKARGRLSFIVRISDEAMRVVTVWAVAPIVPGADHCVTIQE